MDTRVCNYPNRLFFFMNQHHWYKFMLATPIGICISATHLVMSDRFTHFLLFYLLCNILCSVLENKHIDWVTGMLTFHSFKKGFLWASTSQMSTLTTATSIFFFHSFHPVCVLHERAEGKQEKCKKITMKTHQL